MNLVFASALEAQLFSMLMPAAIVIALVTWYARSSRRYKNPAGEAPAQMASAGVVTQSAPLPEGNEPAA